MPASRVIPLVPAASPHALGTISLKALPPLALYVHFPWCVRKCPYCDFNSHEVRGAVPENEYIDALITDLETALPAIWGRRVTTIFIGGGTPSLLSARSVDRLLEAVRARVPLAPDAEVTLEANPGVADADRFAGLRAAGVNRLSLGVQSFDAKLLKAIGRIHDECEARAALELALRHFDTVNLDLMYALPGQSLDGACSDIGTALGYGVPHLCAYHLTLEPNTPFHRSPPPLPDGDLAADMQEAIEQRLSAAGYEHYETSAFARPGRRCRHNLNYWRFGDYLGIGAGAHTKISFAERIVRETRHKHPKAYLDAVARGLPVQERHQVALDDLPFEFMMNALRLNEGVPAGLYIERTGLALETLRRQLDAAEQRGLLDVTLERWRPTALGRRFLNDLLQLFLPAPTRSA